MKTPLMRCVTFAMVLAPALIVGCASQSPKAPVTEPSDVRPAVAEAKIERDPGGFTITQPVSVPSGVRHPSTIRSARSKPDNACAADASMSRYRAAIYGFISPRTIRQPCSL